MIIGFQKILSLAALVVDAVASTVLGNTQVPLAKAQITVQITARLKN